MAALMNHEKTLIALLFLVLFEGQICAQIIPQDRLMDWTPGVNVGVPGGIPSRTAIGFTVDSATYGTGLVDASTAIGAAIDSMRFHPGQVVYIPSGTYRLDSRVYRAYAATITIRGAGMGKTILKATSNSQVLLLGTGNWPRPITGISITAGAIKGSTVLTVANTDSITVGKLVRIEQNNLPYVITGTAPTTNTKAMTAMFKVTAKTTTSVTVFPPLPFDFTLSPALVQYSISPLSNTGVEDLTVDCSSISGVGIEFDQAWGCWVKNVEIKNSINRQMMLIAFVSGEIRHCYTHSVVGGGPNHEGIDFYEDGSFNLIEDNITYNGGFPGIIFGDSKGGCVGNVIAYNFSYNANTGASSMAGMDISVSHGPHNMMNLVEGNIAGGMGSDGYFGSTSHILLARNWFTATHPTGTDNLIAVNIGRWNNYFSLVGNVLGTSSFSAGGLFQPVTSFSYASHVIYKLGFPNMGNNGFSLTWGPTTPPDYTLQSVNQPGGDSHGTGGNSLQELDLNVKATMIRHGNYDYLNHSIAWEMAISDQAIPNSYFRSVKPAFFGTLAWPPFDPASPPGAFNDANISRIPAGYRYINGIDPPGSNAVNNGANAVALFSGFGLKARHIPFSKSLCITYRIPKASHVDISIIDLNGRLMKTLVSGDKEAGMFSTVWEGKESSAPSGVCCLTMKAGGHSETIRVVVTRQ
jgi:hypothetical protein